MKRERKAKIIHAPIDKGVLVWQLPNGKILGDAEGNYLSVDAVKGDLGAVKRMREAAAYYGYPEGQTMFLPGRSKITDSMHDDQMEALTNGDELPFDIPDDAWRNNG